MLFLDGGLLSYTNFHISAISVSGKCHQNRQVVYIFNKITVHFLFVAEIKDFLNHCGRRGT